MCIPKQLKTNVILTIAMLLFALACANRGNPEGGPIDESPPVIKRIYPKNFSTNFSAKEITIVFDEYVKIKNLRKQLIISPPMNIEPTVYPQSGASKEIVIKLKDTLKNNTTYAFNFGESIVDNNEENPYPYFKYVFSTGEIIDSLSVKGLVVDAFQEQPDAFVSVMLYEADTTYTDSIVFKEKPRYITNTLDSLTTFSIDNIKAGRYKLIALKDENNNFVFNQKIDKIGYKQAFINVPKDTSYVLKLFKEAINFKAYKPKQASKYKLIFPYEGSYEEMRIGVLAHKPQGFKTRITKNPETDTLYYWYNPKFEVDSTVFVVRHQSTIDTFKYKFRDFNADSLEFNVTSKITLNFDEDFTIEASTPLSAIDTSKVKLINKDSLKVPYTAVYDTLYNRYKFSVNKAENENYDITFLPDTFTDFYNHTNKDTMNYKFKTRSKADFGNIRLQLINPKYPIIVQLLDPQGHVAYERYTTNYPVVDFNDLVPKQYTLRFILDTNKNGKYDTGNFLKDIQPERIIYAPQPLDEVRASFDFVVPFTFQ